MSTTASKAVIPSPRTPRPDRVVIPERVVDVPEPVLRLAAQVAKVTHRLHRSYVEREDLLQEACEWACRHPEKVQEYLALEEDRSRAALYTSMRNHVRRFVERERAAAEGGPVVYRSPYSRRQIERDLLPAVFHRERWQHPPASGVVEYEDGEWIVALADCADAYRRLDSASREALERVHRDGDVLSDVARAMRLRDDQLSALLARATVTIHRDLSDDEPATVGARTIGLRRAMDNATAVAVTRIQDDGE